MVCWKKVLEKQVKKAKEQKCWFHNTLLTTLSSSLLENLMTGTLVRAKMVRRRVKRVYKRTIGTS